MKVKELIRVLEQFDGDKKVVVQAGNYYLEPTHTHPFNRFGDIVINVVSKFKL